MKDTPSTGPRPVLIALLSALCSATLALYTHIRHDPELESSRQAVRTLQDLQHLQRQYFLATHAFASKTEELALRVPLIEPWRLQMIPFRLESRPMFLIEVQDGRTRYSADSAGILFKSSPRPLPPVPALPPSEEVASEG